MYLPSQEKALGIIQCLDILEKTGEMPTTKDGPLCQKSEEWNAMRLLYHLSEFIDIDCPEFYEGQKEQNSLLAEETLRELIQRDECLSDIYEVLLEYSKEIPEPLSCQIAVPEKKKYHPNNINPEHVPNIWKWKNCQLLFVSVDACLKDPKGSKIEQSIITLMENNEYAPEGLVLYSYQQNKQTKKNIKTKEGKENKYQNLIITEDVWYTMPEPYQLDGLSWLGKNHMCVEQCIDILTKIRGNNININIKDDPKIII